MGSFLNKYKIGYKQAFVGVMTISMLFALILSWIVTSSLTIAIQNRNSYSPNPELFIINDEYRSEMINAVSNEGNVDLLLFLNTWSPLVIFFLSSVFASFMFYNWKMKRPLSILNASIKKINNQELDFSVQYNMQDEMGELIRSFEKMRNELHISIATQWRAQEDRKLLNAAFAHDMRTPLTVLKGQVDVLNRNVKAGKADQQIILNTLTLLARHICRIEKYTDQMGALQRLEEIDAIKIETVWGDFWPVVQSGFEQLAATQGKKIKFDIIKPASHIKIDESIITRILDNIIANAVRYASEIIVLRIEVKNDMMIEVIDDGPGFSEKALQHALKPFYREDPHNNEELSDGLGLFITKTLAERHGGYIEILNNKTGGCVKVILKSVLSFKV